MYNLIEMKFVMADIYVYITRYLISNTPVVINRLRNTFTLENIGHLSPFENEQKVVLVVS